MPAYTPPPAPPVVQQDWTPADTLRELMHRYTVRQTMAPESCCYSWSNLLLSLDALAWIGNEVGPDRKGSSPLPFLGACGLVEYRADGIERTKAGERVLAEWKHTLKTNL